MELKASHSWDPKLEMKTIEALRGVIKLWKLENSRVDLVNAI